MNTTFNPFALREKLCVFLLPLPISYSTANATQVSIDIPFNFTAVTIAKFTLTCRNGPPAICCFAPGY